MSPQGLKEVSQKEEQWELKDKNNYSIWDERRQASKPMIDEAEANMEEPALQSSALCVPDMSERATRTSVRVVPATERSTTSICVD